MTQPEDHTEPEMLNHTLGLPNQPSAPIDRKPRWEVWKLRAGTGSNDGWISRPEYTRDTEEEAREVALSFASQLSIVGAAVVRSDILAACRSKEEFEDLLQRSQVLP